VSRTAGRVVSALVPVSDRQAELEGVFAAQVEAWTAAAREIDLGVSASEIRQAFAPLRERLRGLGSPAADPEPPFALILPGSDAAALVGAVRLEAGGPPGVLDANHGPEGLEPYRPIEQVEIPERAYTLVGIERGDEFRGVAPGAAVATILERGRTPLTIVEGLALALVRPGVLARDHCFSLAGSRRGDKRVPALWISRGAPKLGWCWEGAPHEWLGVASVARRVTSR
jgi:hypothetical protein